MTERAVTVIERWGPGYYLKYIPLQDGEKLILEASDNPPFVVMGSPKASIAGNVADSPR